MIFFSDFVFYNSIICLLFGIISVFFFIGYKKLPVYIGFVSLFFSFYYILLVWWKFDSLFIGFNYNSSYLLWGNHRWEYIFNKYYSSIDSLRFNRFNWVYYSVWERYTKEIYGKWLLNSANWITDNFRGFLSTANTSFDDQSLYVYIINKIKQGILWVVLTCYWFSLRIYIIFENYIFAPLWEHRPRFLNFYNYYLLFFSLEDNWSYIGATTPKYFPKWYWSSDHIGIAYDGISIFFIVLTAFIMPIVLVGSIRFRGFLDAGVLTFFLLVSQLILILAFSTINFFYFFVAFESVLLPLFIMVIAWGSRDRKIKSAFYFLVYTIITSIGFLGVILILGYEIGSTNLLDLLYFYKQEPLSIHNIRPGHTVHVTLVALKESLVSNFILPLNKQIICWLLLFLTLANKLPMFPFYLWLPEAHVEAPTFGSIILAAILLKLGSYGFFRFLVYALPQASYYFAPLVFSLAILSIIFCSLTAIRCLDLKKIIAYSSVAHMNFAILGLFSNTVYGLHGALLLFLGHGLISSALFFLIGVLYDTYGTRSLYYFSGMSQLSPVFSIAFFFFTLANISFPGTINFNAEILVLISIFFVSPFTYLFLLIANILSIIYAVWTFTRLCFGRLQCCFRHKLIRDVQRREIYSLLYLFIYVLLFGLFPCSLLDSMYWNLLRNVLY